MRRLWIPFLLTMTPALAVAQDNDAVADSLYRDGRRLFDAKRFEEACPKLEESLRLDAQAGGTQLLLASCFENTGKLARAWSAYLNAQRLARAAGRDDRLEIAVAGAKRVEALVPFITVRVPPAANVEGLRVRVNGIEIGRGGWGSPTPVDPGPVSVEATAPERAPWSTRLSLASGGGTREVVVPVLAALPKSEEPAPHAGPPLAAPAAAPASVPTPPPSRGQRDEPVESSGAPVAGYVIGGLGLAALGAGAYFGVSSMQKQSDADAKCPARDCTDSDAVALSKDAKSQGTVAWILLGAGAAAVTVGAVIVLGSGSGGERSRSASVGLSVHSRGGVASVGGMF